MLVGVIEPIVQLAEGQAGPLHLHIGASDRTVRGGCRMSRMLDFISLKPPMLNNSYCSEAELLGTCFKIT